MNEKRRAAIRGILPVLIAAAALLGAAGLVLAQGQQAQISVELPTEPVKEGGQSFKVNVVVDKVTNLAAYQFGLTFDSSILQYVGVENGPFLGSSGRDPQCPEPRVEGENPMMVRFNCVTLGAPVSLGGTKGPDGSGLLATVTFSPIGGGKTTLDLSEGRLVAAEIDERGAPVEIEAEMGQGAALEVKSSGGGANWAIWGAVVGAAVVAVIVGGVVLARRLRGRGGLGKIG